MADRAILLIWAALIWGLAMVRFFGWRRCPVDDLDHDAIARRWGRFAVAVSSLAGVLWGGMRMTKGMPTAIPMNIVCGLLKTL